MTPAKAFMQWLQLLPVRHTDCRQPLPSKRERRRHPSWRLLRRAGGIRLWWKMWRPAFATDPDPKGFRSYFHVATRRT